MAINMEKIEKAVRDILEAVGEDPDREGLKDTPKRFARFYQEAFAGMNEDPSHYLTVQFSENHEEMVIVKDIPIYSTCELSIPAASGQQSCDIRPEFLSHPATVLAISGQLTGTPKMKSCTM